MRLVNKSLATRHIRAANHRGVSKEFGREDKTWRIWVEWGLETERSSRYAVTSRAALVRQADRYASLLQGLRRD